MTIMSPEPLAAAGVTAPVAGVAAPAAAVGCATAWVGAAATVGAAEACVGAADACVGAAAGCAGGVLLHAESKTAESATMLITPCARFCTDLSISDPSLYQNWFADWRALRVKRQGASALECP